MRRIRIGAVPSVLFAMVFAFFSGYAAGQRQAPTQTAGQATATLTDFTTSAKGSPLKKLQSILHIADANVMAQPDSASPVQFRVILGDDYNPCPRLDWLPQPEATPAP